MSQEEIQIPQGWKLEKLGNTFEESDQKWLPNSKSELVNYVGLENIESDTGVLVNFTPVENSKIKSSKTVFTKKTVLYGKLRPYLNKVLLPTFDGICSTDILSLIPKSTMDRQFLAYFLRSQHVLSLTKKSMQGTKMPRTKIQVLQEIQLALPPLDIQKKIVQKLDHILGELKEKKKQILSLINQNKEQIDFFEKNWISYIIDNQIEKHPQRSEWKLTKLTMVTSNIMKGVFDMNPQNYQNSGIPFLRISDLKNNQVILTSNSKYISKEKNLEFPSSIMTVGDIVMAKVGSVGEIDKIAKIPASIPLCNISQNMVGMKIISAKINSDFLFNYLRSKHVMAQILEGTTHTSLKSLRLGILRNLNIPLPLISIQKEIVQNIKNAEKKFKEQKKQFENIKQNYESKINYINYLQSTILDSAFTGKLVPQDPNDEPASELLKRIKSEN